MITLTEAAAEHVKSFPGEPRLRITLAKNGCSGYSYETTMITRIDPGDCSFESYGVTVVITEDDLPYLDGMVVDYIKDKFNTRFEFNNPNVVNSCGCGDSFNFEELKIESK